MSVRVAVDVGSTFTDVALYDESTGTVRVSKRMTIPSALQKGVVGALDDVIGNSELHQVAYFLHATTVGINTLLEHVGPTLGMLTTAGFRDVLDLRRGTRGARMYDLMWKAPPPLVPRWLRRPIRERVAPDGKVVVPLEAEDVRAACAVFLAAGVRSVAIAFFNAYANSEHETRAAEVLRENGFTGDISLSHELSREVFEYERTATTVIDAYVRPRVTHYLGDLETALHTRGFSGDCLIMRSGGGTARFEEAVHRPFESIMSGPVAGAVAAGHLARTHGIERAVAADAGGTSFDTCLLLDGRPPLLYLHEGELLGLPIMGERVDVRSIGAGGGSIARAEGGLLRVGPQSAGANPGPACYGRGGTAPTVTDAAATLGMLADGQLAGGLRLDLDLAQQVIAGLGRSLGMETDAAAQGVISVMVAAMAAAIRGSTVELGEDPRRMALIAYGGAAPLFACALLDELGMEQALIPTSAGNFSACGLLQQELTRSAAQTTSLLLSSEALEASQSILKELFSRLAAEANGERQVTADLRYLGQLYALTVAVPCHTDGRVAVDAAELQRTFEAAYGRQFGHTLEGPIEITALRAKIVVRKPEMTFRGESLPLDGLASPATMWAFSSSAARHVDFAVTQRTSLRPGEAVHGPAIIREATATTFLDVGFVARVLHDHTLQISKVSHMSNTLIEPSVDAVTAEIVRYGLAGAADEMRRTLVRTAFSPIVYEGQDFAAAFYDPDQRLLAQCQTLPLFQGTLDVCIKNALARLGGPTGLAPGDMILLNYPWDTGSHANDMALVAPYFFDGRLVGYVVIKAHHMDIGGMYPGVTTESRDVWQEGRLWPAVKVFEGGVRNEEIYRTLLMNTRTPAAFDGDLSAQCGAARIGLAGLERVIRRHGLQKFDAAVEALFRHGERHMRDLIRSLPNGRWTAHGAHDGGSGGLQAPAQYEVTIEIDEDQISVDLTQAAPQAAGPVNSPRASVVSAVRAAIMAYAGAAEIANHGHFQPISVLTQPGTIFDPLPGAPVGLYAFPLIQTYDVLLAALAQAVPGSVPAAGGDIAGFALWGVRENGAFWGGATHFCGGQGASATYGDGGSPVMSIPASGVRNSSFEAWEATIPVVVLKAEYAQDSGGAGRWQGSPGISVHMKTLIEMDLTSIFERTQTPPFGLAGGEPGRPNRLTLYYPDGSSEAVSRSNRRIPAGTLIEIELSGGGGYGPPQERSIKAVRNDLRDELISEGRARQRYPHAF